MSNYVSDARLHLNNLADEKLANDTKDYLIGIVCRKDARVVNIYSLRDLDVVQYRKLKQNFDHHMEVNTHELAEALIDYVGKHKDVDIEFKGKE